MDLCAHEKHDGKWDVVFIQEMNTGICSKLPPHSENSRKLGLKRSLFLLSEGSAGNKMIELKSDCGDQVAM